MKTVTVERSFRAPVDVVWRFWTTKDGIEAWWGPGGFAVTVRTLELRPGGALEYEMTAVVPETIAYMKQAGMPATNLHRGSFREIVPPNRLVYDHLVDFVPGIAPYSIMHRVELFAVGDETRMVLTLDAMHDQEWTDRAVMGWKMEFEKLAKALPA